MYQANVHLLKNLAGCVRAMEILISLCYMCFLLHISHVDRDYYKDNMDQLEERLSNLHISLSSKAMQRVQSSHLNCRSPKVKELVQLFDDCMKMVSF